MLLKPSGMPEEFWNWACCWSCCRRRATRLFTACSLPILASLIRLASSCPNTRSWFHRFGRILLVISPFSFICLVNPWCLTGLQVLAIRRGNHLSEYFAQGALENIQKKKKKVRKRYIITFYKRNKIIQFRGSLLRRWNRFTLSLWCNLLFTGGSRCWSTSGGHEKRNKHCDTHVSILYQFEIFEKFVLISWKLCK